METLPKNVINNIFLFLRHPVAELLRNEGIFLYMKMRLTPELRYRGSPFECADRDAYSNRHSTPRKYILVNGRRLHTRDLTEEEDFAYLTVYNHFTPFLHHQWGFVTDWSIKGKGHLQPYNLSSDYSDTDSDSDSDGDSTNTDSDSD